MADVTTAVIENGPRRITGLTQCYTSRSPLLPALFLSPQHILGTGAAVERTRQHE